MATMAGECREPDGLKQVPWGKGRAGTQTHVSLNPVSCATWNNFLTAKSHLFIDFFGNIYQIPTMSESKYWSTRLYGIGSVFLLIKTKTTVPT